ncbi:MAG: DUF6113 family protein [Oryzihumus sp.]
MLRHLGATLLGATVALASVADHRFAAGALPWGLLLAITASAGAAWRLRSSRYPRTATSYGAGWLVLFSLVVLGRPEGDYAIASDLAGYAMMALALVVVALAVSPLAARTPDSELPRT